MQTQAEGLRGVDQPWVLGADFDGVDCIMVKARITEVYNSIQGEGVYIGREQTFVRFYGCNLLCEFCDEIQETHYLTYTTAQLIEEIEKERKDTVSLTGGEPILQSDFLKEFLPALRKEGQRIYLETNGTLPDRLIDVLDYIDIISMDLKLPSSTGSRSYWKEHFLFLRESIKKEVFVKAVVTPNTTLEDIEKATSIVKAVNRNIPFVIQPVSYNGKIAHLELLSVFYGWAKKHLYDVRVIPQIHKFLGIR